MGWERKRGKIEEWNRLLRGATDTSFTVEAGDAAVFPAVRYCITLDSDTRLPRDAAKKLIGIAAHPAEPAPLRPASRPRHRGLRDPPAAGERDHGERRRLALRAALRRPHRRRPLHDRGLRHLPGPLRRGDLHRQGALRRGRVHRRPRGARARERAALARPLRGALRAHGARHRHRGRRRLSGERPRPRAPPAPLGARRLADPVVAVPGRPDPRRPAPQPPAAHLPLEDPRQPAAQPDGAGDRGPAAARLDGPAGKPRGSGRPRSWPRSPSASTRWRSRPWAARRRSSRGASSCGW